MLLRSGQALIRAGAGADNTDDEGITALGYAARSGNLAAIRVLADKAPSTLKTGGGTPADKAPLWLAAVHAHVHAIKELMRFTGAAAADETLLALLAAGDLKASRLMSHAAGSSVESAAFPRPPPPASSARLQSK